MYLSVIECHKQNDSKLRCNDMSTEHLANNKSPSSGSIPRRGGRVWGERKIYENNETLPNTKYVDLIYFISICWDNVCAVLSIKGCRLGIWVVFCCFARSSAWWLFIGYHKRFMLMCDVWCVYAIRRLHEYKFNLIVYDLLDFHKPSLIIIIPFTVYQQTT